MWSANLRVRVHLRMCVCALCVSPHAYMRLWVCLCLGVHVLPACECVGLQVCVPVLIGS